MNKCDFCELRNADKVKSWAKSNSRKKEFIFCGKPECYEKARYACKIMYKTALKKEAEEMKGYQCFKCGSNYTVGIILFGNGESNQICQKCWEHPFKSNKEDSEGWIWPMRQLPDVKQKVEVKRLGFNRNFKAIFEGELFVEEGSEDKVVEDVIAWRPRREEKLVNSPICPECHKPFYRNPIGAMGLISKSMYCDKCTEGFQNPKPEERRPDFSKLREGDFIMITYCDSKELHSLFFHGQDKLTIVGANYKASLQNGYMYFYKHEIKKIIRINIDSEKIIHLTDSIKYCIVEEI